MIKQFPTKFQIYEESTKGLDWGNYANENILLHTFSQSKKARMLTDTIVNYVANQIPQMKSKKASLWDSFLKGGNERTVDSDEVEWLLKGSGYVEILQTENLYPNQKYVGHDHQEFQIKLDTERFKVGDVIAPDVAKDIQFIIQYLPVKDGLDFIYTGVLADISEKAYFPNELLEPGIRWCKITSTYGEASRDYGSTWFDNQASYIKFRSSLSDWGKQFEVTNKAHQLNLKGVITDEKGLPMEQYPSQIISWVEAEFLAQAKWEKQMMIWYGRSIGKKVLDHSSGYHRRMGPGVEEFLEDSSLTTFPLDSFDPAIIRDFLIEARANLGYDGSVVEVGTGIGGMLQASDALRDIYNNLNVQTPFNTFVKTGASTMPGSGIQGFGIKEAYFLEWECLPGLTIKFVHYPFLDDKEMNGAIVHPKTGIPLSSYKYYVMDWGLGTGGNVELLKREGAEGFAYICGTWSPAGPINGGTNSAGFSKSASHPGRYYTLTAQDSFGVRVKDVQLCSIFLPTVQQ
jgi:hypothetical protein